jgi:hypothetical protein
LRRIPERTSLDGVTSERVLAPDGRFWFRLAPSGEPEHVRLVVGADDPVFESAMTWPEWFPLRAAWDDAGRIWVSSGDVGISVFAPEDGSWRRYAWEEGDTTGRLPLHDVVTNETVTWIDGTPPSELRGPHA